MMFNMFLIFSLVFISTFFIGQLIERFRVLWVFGVMIVGLFFAVYSPFSKIISSDMFQVFANLITKWKVISKHVKT